MTFFSTNFDEWTWDNMNEVMCRVRTYGRYKLTFIWLECSIVIIFENSIIKITANKLEYEKEIRCHCSYFNLEFLVNYNWIFRIVKYHLIQKPKSIYNCLFGKFCHHFLSNRTKNWTSQQWIWFKNNENLFVISMTFVLIIIAYDTANCQWEKSVKMNARIECGK